MGSIQRMFAPSKSAIASIAFVALVYLTTLSLLQLRGFWVIDNANKFLQMQTIIGSGYHRYDIPWTGAAVDPSFMANPMPSPFSYVADGKLYSIFSPVFAVVSSIPYRMFGFPGLYLLPFIGSILALAGVARIGREAGMGKNAVHGAVLIAGLLTPLWFYSLTFWEHTVAAACCVWAVYGFLRYIRGGGTAQLLTGSVVAAMGVYFRDELYLFCLILLAAVVLYGPGRRGRTAAITAGAMAAALLPLWLFQWWAIGKPFGVHLGVHVASVAGIAGHLATRPTVLYNMLLAFLPWKGWSVLLATPFIVLFAWSPRLSRSGAALAVPVTAAAATVLALVSLGGYVFADSPGWWMFQTNSLFSTVPLLMVGFIGVREPGDSFRRPTALRLVWMIALAYAVGYVLAAPELGSTGIHWGNRYLLPLYPLLSLLAAVAVARWVETGRGHTAGWVAIALAVLVTSSAQTNSVRLLAAKKDFSRRVNLALDGRPEQALVATAWWIPQELYRHFPEMPMFYVETSDEFTRLLGLLRAQGYGSFLFATVTPGQTPEEAFSVDDPVLNTFNVTFIPGELPPESAPSAE